MEVTPKEQLEQILARLPGMKASIKKATAAASELGFPLDPDFLDCIQVIEQFPTMLEQAKRDALEEAARELEGMTLGTTKILTLREVAVAIRKLAGRPAGKEL